MDARSGREALKCALPPKTLRKEGILLNKVWLRLSSPLVHPFMQATSSQMGGRYSYPVTLYVKQRWSS